MVVQTVERLLRQPSPPDLLLVVGASAEDVGGLEAIHSPLLRVVRSERGSCRQRNRALDLLEAESEVIAFLDDDYVPAGDMLGSVRAFLSAHPDVVVASGKLLADGIMSPGLSFKEADDLAAGYVPAHPVAVVDVADAYGCNMIVRTSATVGQRFDERLPLYGWQEDVDYSIRLTEFGRAVRTNAFAGVHLGVKTGRTSGKRLGYSQIANPLYLWQKGTMSLWRSFGLIVRNVIANLVKSAWSEPYVDRRGRLLGNSLAFYDLFRGRCKPERVLSI